MITGDPGVLEGAADQLESTGARLDAAGDVIARQARVLASQWTGSASDAANAKLTTLSNRAGVGSDATSAAAPVLRIFAAELRAAQAAYAEAQAEAQVAGAAFYRGDAGRADRERRGSGRDRAPGCLRAGER